MNLESGTNIGTPHTIRSFTGLLAWQEAHKLALSIYRTTSIFPKQEMFGLVTQLRRAAVSVTSNIAEGFSRHSWKEKVQFFSIALGSLTELQSQLILSRDIGYINIKEFDLISMQAVATNKILNALLKKTKTIRLSRF